MISIKNLSFYYQPKRPVFEHVSFEMNTGIYGLLGENGVGKTTLLHIISGLRFPKKGTCEVFGIPSYKRDPDILKQVFFLPEEFQAPAVSLFELAKYNGEFYSRYSYDQLKKYLEELEVDGTRKITELSTGQKKKAYLAYGLSLNTPITLLDEPTNGLDIPSKSQFRKLLSMAGSEEKCIIISTHQVRDLSQMIDPIIILDQNSVLLNQSVKNITSKLIFKHTATVPENALFSEQTLEGYLSVCPNTEQKESTLNIEALFNAVVKNKAFIKDLFNS
ncbi:MAG: ABC transporter ATP-binding protein [Tannerellaceae bacterium]|nr:ABC transporter ATP-binding protein [Tannerellaceae bacterium]